MPSQEADLLLLDEVRTLVDQALALVAATRDTHVSLRRTLGPLATTHRAHARRLDGAGRVPATTDTPVGTPAGPPAGRVRVDRARALVEVRAREERLRWILADRAVQAGSGAFAQLLGSMSASLAQHLAGLRVGP